MDYYKLKWDPSVIVEPTIKEIMMQQGESAQSIFTDIISRYRRSGYFAVKTDGNGAVFEAKEAVVFVNEVKTIIGIIKDNRLKPDEVTILVSATNKHVKELEKMGFKINNQSADKFNPLNTTYTFFSKASFEGRDFYSTSAFTYIFIDGTKDWEIHDTSIEIPQMLGRQRLDANPFKHNAVIYYRTKPACKTMGEYLKAIADKLNDSQALVNSYDSGDANHKRLLTSLVKNQDPNNRYQSNYLEIINDADGGYCLGINYLVAASEHNLAINKTQIYNNSLFLTTAIQSQIANCNTKPQELRDFEKRFNNAQTFSDKMSLYCGFLSCYPQYNAALLSNPFIDMRYHSYYAQLGPTELRNLNYDEDAIVQELNLREIISICQIRFQKGHAYTLPEAKAILQEIYDSLGLGIKAKANQLQTYIPVEPVQRKLHDVTRSRMLLIK